MESNFILLWTAVFASFHLLMILPDCAGEANSKKNIDVMIENSKKRQQNNLTCHVCHSEKNSECLSFANNDIEDFMGFPQMCQYNDTSCMVKRISFTTSTGENGTLPMKTVAVNRTCSAKCEPGCVIMGERTRLYVCSTCCTTPLCNIGNGACEKWPNFTHLTLPALLATFQWLTRNSVTNHHASALS